MAPGGRRTRHRGQEVPPSALCLARHNQQKGCCFVHVTTGPRGTSRQIAHTGGSWKEIRRTPCCCMEADVGTSVRGISWRPQQGIGAEVVVVVADVGSGQGGEVWWTAMWAMGRRNSRWKCVQLVWNASRTRSWREATEAWERRDRPWTSHSGPSHRPLTRYSTQPRRNGKNDLQ